MFGCGLDRVFLKDLLSLPAPVMFQDVSFKTTKKKYNCYFQSTYLFISDQYINYICF